MTTLPPGAALAALRKTETALVVEGYLDLLALRVNGVANVVATLGTALTREQVRLLKSLAAKVVLLFDGEGYVLMQGLVGADLREEYVPAFRAMARSLLTMASSGIQVPSVARNSCCGSLAGTAVPISFR